MSELVENDTHLSDKASCEERLKACEVMLMLNQTNAQQVMQHRLAYEQACLDIKDLRARIIALENELDTIHRQGARTVDAMAEYLELTETLDFKVPGARLRFLVDYDRIYLRFDRNGELKHAYSPEEYNAVITKEWDDINK